MKPVVAFDIGKVLLDFNYGILITKLAPRTQCNEVELDAYLNQSPLLAEYESGQLTSFGIFHTHSKRNEIHRDRIRVCGVVRGYFYAN